MCRLNIKKVKFFIDTCKNPIRILPIYDYIYLIKFIKLRTHVKWGKHIQVQLAEICVLDGNNHIS